MKSLKVCLICFLTFHYLTLFFSFFICVFLFKPLSLRTLDVGEGRMGCYCSFLFIILFISLLIYLNVLIIIFPLLVIFFFFWSTLARLRCIVVLSSPLRWPCGDLVLLGPTPSGIRGCASIMEVSLLCCIVNMLLIYLRFYSKIYVILFNTYHIIQDTT